MFGRDNTEKYVREGNLEKLKKSIGKKPELLEKDYSWQNNDYTGSILHMAAFYNQPRIVEYLVNDKGMDVEKLALNNWTPLHHAATANATRAVEALLKLGANPRAITAEKTSVYGFATDAETKRLLQPYRDEELKEQARKEAEAAREKKETERQDAATRADGTWIPTSPDKITHECELPGGQYSLTSIFNFATESLTLITKDLKDGGISSETKFFDDIPGKKKILEEPRARLAEFNSASAAKETAVEQAPVVRRTAHDFKELTGARL